MLELESNNAFDDEIKHKKERTVNKCSYNLQKQFKHS